MKSAWIPCVFWLSAVYDLVLGIAFLFATESIFAHFEGPPPNHLGYVHFPAALLLVFAVMYGRIALNPAGRRELMPYGIGLKISYAAVAFYHHLSAGIPAIWVPFAWIDLAFAGAFVAAWKVTRGK